MSPSQEFEYCPSCSTDGVCVCVYTHVLDTLQGCRRSLHQALSCHLSLGAQVQTDYCFLSDGGLANYWNWPSGHPGGGSVSWQEDLRTHLCWGTPQKQMVLWTGGKEKHVNVKCWNTCMHVCTPSLPPCSPAGHCRCCGLSRASALPKITEVRAGFQK